MVADVLNPLNIFIVGLGGGFLIPLFYRLGKSWVTAAFVFVLAAMTLISGYNLVSLLQGSSPIEILTGGTTPPYAINLRMGLAEGIFAFSVNLVALFGIGYVVREKYPILLLYILLIVGIQGMVMTRDLFNLFVFLEIVSIATYGLLGLRIRRLHCRPRSNFSWPRCWHPHFSWSAPCCFMRQLASSTSMI